MFGFGLLCVDVLCGFENPGTPSASIVFRSARRRLFAQFAKRVFAEYLIHLQDPGDFRFEHFTACPVESVNRFHDGFLIRSRGMKEVIQRGLSLVDGGMQVDSFHVLLILEIHEDIDLIFRGACLGQLFSRR